MPGGHVGDSDCEGSEHVDHHVYRRHPPEWQALEPLGDPHSHYWPLLSGSGLWTAQRPAGGPSPHGPSLEEVLDPYRHLGHQGGDLDTRLTPIRVHQINL